MSTCSKPVHALAISMSDNVCRIIQLGYFFQASGQSKVLLLLLFGLMHDSHQKCLADTCRRLFCGVCCCSSSIGWPYHFWLPLTHLLPLQNDTHQVQTR